MLRYAITDRQFLAPDTVIPAIDLDLQATALDLQATALARQAASLARAGVDFLQLREKDLRPPELLWLAHAIQAAINETGGSLSLLINGPPAESLAVALGSGAAGLHLRSNWAFSGVRAASAEILATRTAFRTGRGIDPLLSVSTHSLAEVEQARAAGADLLLFGPVFAKVVRGEPHAMGVGLELLAQAAALARPLPVLALGGVTAENAPACLAAGAAGMAGIRPFLAPRPGTRDTSA